AADTHQYRGEAAHAHPRLRRVAGALGEPHDRCAQRALPQRHPACGRALRRSDPGRATELGRIDTGHSRVLDSRERMARGEAEAPLTTRTIKEIGTWRSGHSG